MILGSFSFSGDFPCYLTQWCYITEIHACFHCSPLLFDQCWKSVGFLIEYVKGITPGILPDIVEKDLEGKKQWLVSQL